MESVAGSGSIRGASHRSPGASCKTTLNSLEQGLTRKAINWPAVVSGVVMVVTTSGQGLFLSVADERLEACGANITETVFWADLLLVAVSSFVLLGIIGWRSARGGVNRVETANCMTVPKCKVVKFMTVGAIGTVDDMMYLQAMTYHNPAAVMILRLACSLVMVTLGQIALGMLKSTGVKIFGLLLLVLGTVTHIIAVAAENPAGAALMDACIHVGFNGGQFPIHSFGCGESMFLIAIAAAYVSTYKLAMVLCGGMASVVLLVLNPMMTYMATCLALQQLPDLQQCVSALTVLTWIVWYNIAPIWDSHVSSKVKRRTIAKELTIIESHPRAKLLARATKRGGDNL